MFNANELLHIIESIEDNGLDLQFNEVMLSFVHPLRPDVPITLYIGGSWEEQVGLDDGEVIH